MFTIILRITLALLLWGASFPLARAQDTDQSSAVQPIVGSTARTAQQGYSHTETLRHLANFDHKRWDVKDDETKRFVHLNGPQLFTHAWVHRAGPISTLETNYQKQLGSVKASTPIGEITLDQWLAQWHGRRLSGAPPGGRLFSSNTRACVLSTSTTGGPLEKAWSEPSLPCSKMKAGSTFSRA